MVQLYDVINSAGGNRNSNERKKLSDSGYTLDKEHSNHNNQVYHNKSTNDVIYNVRGSHNVKDWLVNNTALLTGNLKKTQRYMESHKGIRDVKAKYKIDKINITGESLGGGIASLASGKNDKVTTYNKATTLGQKHRSHEKSFRVAGDAVSLFNANHSNTKTLANNHIILPSTVANIYNAHSTKTLKEHNISI